MELYYSFVIGPELDATSEKHRWTGRLSSSSQRCQLGYGVHVAGGAVRRRRDPQLRFGHSRAVVDVNLPLAEPDFFAGLTGDFRQSRRGRRFVQEDRHGSIGGGLRKGVGFPDRGQLGGGSDQNADGLAGMGPQAGLQSRLDLRFGFPALEDYITAGDEGPYRGKSSASQMAFSSPIGSLPVPPTLTARRSAMKVINSGLAIRTGLSVSRIRTCRAPRSLRIRRECPSHSKAPFRQIPVMPVPMRTWGTTENRCKGAVSRQAPVGVLLGIRLAICLLI